MKIFEDALIPKCTRNFIQRVTKQYKENNQSVVCSTCYKFDCLKRSHIKMSCRDFIINAHICYVVKIAKSFPIKQRLDLIEEALTVVTDVLTNHTEKVEYNKITSFIGSIARYTMLTYLKYDKIVGPKTKKTVTVISFDDIEDKKVGSITDLRDTINQCCNTDYKRFIATCIMEGGWTVQEMADELNISLAYAGKIKSNLESEIWTKWRGNNEKFTKRVCQLSEHNGR